MKLHLPVFLRKAILALMLAYGVPAVHAATLTLGAEDSLSVDYSVSGSLLDLNNGTLQLSGGTTLQLSSCGEGDGKTYILLTGVSELLDAQGNVISLDSTNNAASRYFDASQPGTGFWADATLQLSADGILRLVRHSEAVKAAVTISTRRTGSVDYQYYEGVHFADIEYTSGSSTDSYACGGAIYGDDGSTITLSNNGSVVFEGNTASSSDYYADGGAIYGDDGSTITLSNNGSVVFEGNTASSSDYYADGGAIYGGYYSTITLSDNGSVVFDGNTASGSSSADGGAIYGWRSPITLSNNGSVTFSGNTASSSSSSACGGAIHGDSSSTITLSGNGSVTFSGNTASGSYYAYGGAIYGDSYSTITLSGNGSVTFSGNTASGSYFAFGGAIYGYEDVTLSDNGSVTFSGNTASSSSSAARGGAIHGDSSSTITLSDNGSVTFSGNTASASSYSFACGGAIYGYEDVTLSDNESVSFSGNTASASSSASGGAIDGGSITLSDNGSVTFSGNTASASSDDSANGGAIYTQGDLNIRNNDSVEFYQNAEVANGNTYRLRSIYAGGSGVVISFSSAAGKSITFRDSIYIGEGSSFKLNEAYEGKAQLGDIIFTGATTVDDLYTVKGYVAGTAEEIRLSRTSEVNTLTELYGGRLRVEEGTIYQGRGITAMEGSGATVRVQNATLSHSGYDLIFNAGTTLELTGANTITGNVQMLEGSALVFDLTQYQGTTIHSGSWSVADGALVSVALDSSGWTGEWGEVKTIVLLKTDAEHSASQFDSSISPLTGNWECSGLQWVDGTLSIAFKNGATNAEWTNAAGDFRWNNESYNWTDSGFTFARVNGADVTFGKSAEGSILLDGQMEVGKMTVSADAVYALVFATGASLTVQKDLVLGAGSDLKVHGNLAAAGVNSQGNLVVDGELNVTNAVTASSIQAGSLLADSLNLTNAENRGFITGDATVAGEVVAAGHLNVGGSLTASSLQAASLEAGSLILTGSGAGNVVTGTLNVEGPVQSSADLSVGGAMSAQQVCVDGALTAASLQTEALEAASLTLTDGAASNRIGSSVAMTGAVESAGSLTVEGTLTAAELTAGGALSAQQVSVAGALTAASLQTDALGAASLKLTDGAASNHIGSSVAMTGAVESAGSLTVEGALTAASLQTGALEVGSLVLTAGNTDNTVTGNLTAESVSLVAGSSLAVGGVLTTDEVQMSGTALTLTAGSFGASTMNFELDRAALESLGLAHGTTAVIARSTSSLPEEFAVTLNGTTDFVQAAAYEYKISATGNTVQVLADYAHEGMQVWYRGAWVGDFAWSDYHIAGYDAVDGVENVNLRNRSHSGDMLIVALEQGVHSAVITGAELEFANVDLGGGELVLGAGTTLTATEIYGPGETLSVLENAALRADAVQLGVLHLEYTDVSLKDASIGAITGTTGKLTIARNGKVTVNSDVELGSFLNEGTLNLGSHSLRVNALTDKGGNVTAAEVSVQCRASRMAEFDMLIADRVTVTNNVAGARYSDDIVLGDGSVVGELLADKLVVKGGTVTLGSTTAETVQNVHALELQNGATLILNQTFVELGEDFVASDGSSIQLEEGGNVLRGDLGVSSLEEALVLDATTITGDELPSTLSNARMTAYGDDAARYDGLLLDSAVVNEGRGTFSVNNSGNALVEIEASGGDVLVYNVPTHALRKLEIADGKTVSAYSAGTAHAAYEASVVLNGTARIGRFARLNANLVVKSGSSLNLAGSLTMGSSLELESGLTLGGVVFSSLQSAQSGAVIGLFNGVDELTLAGQKYNAISLSDGVLASVVFSNLENNGAHEYYFVYDSATQGEGELGICYNYNDNYVTPDEPEIPDTPVTPDEPEIPDTPVTPDEPEIPDTPVTPDEPEIPDTPVTPEEPEIPEPLKPFRPGDSALVSSEIDKNMEVILNGKGTLTLEGKVNAGAITVVSDKNITFKSNKKKPGSLSGDGRLTKKGKGTLILNDGNSSWKGDTYLEAGTIKVKGTSSLGKGDVYVKGGTLNLGSKAVANDITQSGSAAIKSGKKFTGTYTLESGELQKGSTLNISKTATLAGGTVNGTLSGNGKTTVTGKVKLGDKGKITTKALTLGADATLTTSAKGLSSKTTTLSIGEDATMSLGGKMTVDSVKINGGTLKTTGSKPAAMTVKNDMELTDAVLTTNGKVSTNKLTLNDSEMSIKGAKAQNLTVKQNLTIGSGSALTLNGKLSAGSLTIKKDGMLTMTGSKPVTLKVKGALTLSEGSSIILNYSFVQGKTYKVLTFGSYSGSKDYYSIFGVEADDCTITNTGKALTLTVNTKWKPQTQQKAVSADTAPPIVAAKPQVSPVADALVQANWGQLEASRAFVNAMANRSMAVQLGNGERAVWASAIGSSSRHDTAGGHNGADTNVSGGAFGLETQVGRASLFGMALGNSWTRVSAHGFGTIEQDTTHLGLYGQTNWRSGISADWSAAYGRSESESMGSDWSQKQLQLDGRVSYNHELNARTVLSPFAGVQYYASDSASIGTTDTGSLQNLRAEIGVGASHRTGKLGVFGEIALHQDMARNNPTVSMEGVRSTGMNPGRTGINFTIGASYELSDKWSVNASYTGEFVENANAHSANVGASYKF